MINAEAILKPRPRLPEWLRLRLPTSDTFSHTRNLLQNLRLHTVCESAKCPNHWECWSKGTATFMIAGDRCTRACGFCAVTTAKPFALEADEPARVAEATRRMKLQPRGYYRGGARRSGRWRRRPFPRDHRGRSRVEPGYCYRSAHAGFQRSGRLRSTSCCPFIRTSLITIWKRCGA